MHFMEEGLYYITTLYKKLRVEGIYEQVYFNAENHLSSIAESFIVCLLLKIKF